MAKFIQVCNNEVIDEFESNEVVGVSETRELAQKDSQEWANLNDTEVTIYEVVSEVTVEPQDEEEVEVDEDGDPDGALDRT